MAYENCPDCNHRKHQLVACPKCGFQRNRIYKEVTNREASTLKPGTTSEHKKKAAPIVPSLPSRKTKRKNTQKKVGQKAKKYAGSKSIYSGLTHVTSTRDWNKVK